MVSAKSADLKASPHQLIFFYAFNWKDEVEEPCQQIYFLTLGEMIDARTLDISAYIK